MCNLRVCKVLDRFLALGGVGTKRREDGKQKRVNVLLSSEAKFDATGCDEGREVGRGAGYFGGMSSGGEAAGVRQRSQLEMLATTRIARMSRVSERNNIQCLNGRIKAGACPTSSAIASELQSGLWTWTLCACLFGRCGPRLSTISPSTSHFRHFCIGYTPSPDTLVR
jgi:hypothetical protein